MISFARALSWSVWAAIWDDMGRAVARDLVALVHRLILGLGGRPDGFSLLILSVPKHICFKDEGYNEGYS